MWSQLTLVTDAELGQLEPEATDPSKPWGKNLWGPQRAQAKRDLKVWLERDFAKLTGGRAAIAVPAIADRVLDRWKPDYAFQYTGAAYTDVTTAVSDDTENDLTLSTVFATPASDRLYIGALWEFEGLYIKLLNALSATASVLTAKYWSPTGWASLSATDGTIAASGKTCSGSGKVTWTIPSDWEPRRLNGTNDEFFWIELSVSAALTAGTKATQILPVRAPEGLKRVAAYLALAHIFRGLAAGAAEPASWLSRVSNPEKTGYQDRAEALYDQLLERGGIPLDLNFSEAIESPERAVTQPFRLYRGR